MRKIIFIYFGANVLLILPIIISGRPYIDDLGRSIDGYRDWEHVGRPLASWFFYILNLGDPAVNVFPLNQLLAALFLGVACMLLASLFEIKKSFLALIAALPLGGQPYFLENLSYAFDSVTMTAGLLSAVGASYLALTSKGYWMSVLATTLVVASFCLYQQTTTAYFLILFFMLARKLPDPCYEKLVFFKALLIGVVGVLVCIAITSYGQGYGMERSVALSYPQFLTGLIHNIALYWGTLYGDWNGSVFGLSALAVIALGLLISILQGTRVAGSGSTLVKSILPVAIFLTITILSMGLPLLLTDFLPVPRFFVGVGVVLALYNLVIVSEVERRLSLQRGFKISKSLVLPSAILLYSMMVFSFAYGKASDAQHDYEISYITRLVQDIESSGVLPGARSIAVLGSIPSSPLLINSTKKFPLMDRLVPRHIRNDWWWGHMQLRYFGLSLKYSKLDATIKSMILAGKMTSLVERKHHDIFMDGDQIIIHFR